MIKDKPDSFWKERLGGLQFEVCIKSGTEKPFSGKYHDQKKKGIYSCSCCGQKLFLSNTKFDSGTGWPSFYEATGKIDCHEDNKLFTKRTEVRCSNCGAHLGHLFDDGPRPTGKRYCINSVSLNFSSG